MVCWWNPSQQLSSAKTTRPFVLLSLVLSGGYCVQCLALLALLALPPRSPSHPLSRWCIPGQRFWYLIGNNEFNFHGMIHCVCYGNKLPGNWILLLIRDPNPRGVTHTDGTRAGMTSSHLLFLWYQLVLRWGGVEGEFYFAETKNYIFWKGKVQQANTRLLLFESLCRAHPVIASVQCNCWSRFVRGKDFQAGELVSETSAFWGCPVSPDMLVSGPSGIWDKKRRKDAQDYIHTSFSPLSEVSLVLACRALLSQIVCESISIREN